MTRPRADGLLILRRVLLANSLAIVVLTGLLVWVFILNGDRVDQINHERQRNTAAGCKLSSQQNQAIIGFLETGGARASTIALARKSFPVLSNDECEETARARVDSP